MHDIVDVIKNIQTLSTSDSAFNILKDFERVLDELDLYVFKNWEDGELLAGPQVDRYAVTCKFLWPREDMPDPDGAKRLLDYGCKVTFQKENMLVPRKVRSPDDFRPGTKKGKIDAHPIWVVSITIPKKLMQDIFQGFVDKENREIADHMHTEQIQQQMDQANAAPETAGGAMEPAPAPTPGATDVPPPTA
jgi:hypothetical protein